MFYQFFSSPQVKRNLIISNKPGMYELPDELPNDLRLRKYIKTSQNYSLVPSLSPKKKILLILAKDPFKTEIDRN